MREIKEKKGITLVALIITIVLMLILVGITVNVAIDSDLIDSTGNTADRMDEKIEYESGLSMSDINIKGRENINVTGGKTTLSNSRGDKLVDYIIYGNAEGVGDYDATTGKYKIPIKVSGKNLFNISNPNLSRQYNTTIQTIANGYKYTCNTNSSYASYVSYDMDFLKIAGKTITVSADFIVSEGNTGMLRIGYWLASGSFKQLKGVSFNTNERKGVTYQIPETLPEDIKSGTSYCFFINVAVNANMKDATLEAKNIQVEVNNAATEYEGYVTPKTITIELDEPLEEGESVSFKADNLPEIPTFNGTTIIEVDTEVKPSNMEITYKTNE